MANESVSSDLVSYSSDLASDLSMFESVFVAFVYKSEREPSFSLTLNKALPKTGDEYR